MATAEEEYHEFDDSEDEEEEEESSIDITDIKSTPSKALRPSTFRDRVFVIHTGDSVQKVKNLKLITLPHPVKGVDAKYFICNKNLLEIQRMIEEPSSWFIDNNVEKDGALFMATPVDPLFIALPFLEKSRRKTADHEGYFSDSIFTTDAWAEVLRNITMDLKQICDEKTIGEDIVVHRLNDSLTITWLRKKVVRLMKMITGDTAVVATGTAAVSTFVRSAGPRVPTVEETFTTALGFLSEYVSPDWIAALKTAFEPQLPKGVAVLDNTNYVTHQPSSSQARSIFDEDDEDEDGRDRKRQKKTPPSTPTSRTSAKANQLKAASKGNAVISSFFAPKKK